MSDTVMIASFGVAYVGLGLMFLGVTLGGIEFKKNWSPVKIRSRRQM